MLLIILVSLLGAVSSQGNLAARSSSHIFQRQVASPRGYVNTNATSASNATADYFALTQDGRLEPIQLVFPEGTQVQKEAPTTATAQFLLTPDGRLEKLEEQPKTNEVVQYFRLTEDGRLEAILEEDVPEDAKEESGEYHVLLPTGSLQRVRFMTTTRGNLLSAKVQYQEVEGISGPVYQYGSPLVRVV